ncbi:MAG: hypothetical protein WAS27_01400 [Candidatus Saccharimonadales bacterium]
MHTQIGDVAVASVSHAIDLASWNIERTNDQLRTFIDAKHAALPDDIEL